MLSSVYGEAKNEKFATFQSAYYHLEINFLPEKPLLD